MSKIIKEEKKNLKEIKQQLEAIKCSLEEYFDDKSENWQNSDAGETVTEEIEHLQDAIDALDELDIQGQ